MSENSFILKVFSPTGLILEENVTSVIFPGTDGEVGVLPQHAHYVGSIGTGLLLFETTIAAEKGRIVISGGFARMKEGELHILADKVILPDEAEDMAIGIEKKELEEFVKNSDGNTPEWSLAQTKLQILNAVESLKNA
ncbi:MAG: ATP synthase F1 subunit epsilon [SAR324 cluster bacterium]|uniref:ATP synthase epsilon chain n=1 Tax=SAR324 cluster bacterium TaxID=2024889 RepID=A0A7X9FPZ0_9DELT|nr:ATP synthase F1 subunit epsilon [SAR324 cluster bacterium]